MPIPPDPILRAAVRWLERLTVSSTARIRTLFITHSDFSDIAPTQYDAALTWLRETGLLGDLDSAVPVQRRVYHCALAYGGAPWLRDADMLIRSPDELPEDALRAAEVLGLTASEAYAQLSVLWRKVETAERSLIGEAGELALVELLTASTTTRVEHVAAWSDGYGYDIAVHAPQYTAHIEVKSTIRRSRFAFFISRNEYETMLRDRAWKLVAIRLTSNLKPAAVASVPREWIADQVPSDCGPCGRWESCRLEVPPEVPEPGIPSLAPVLVSGAPALLSGVAGWLG